jgi:DNA-binding winged helix-turn-helix (wHTH) protein
MSLYGFGPLVLDVAERMLRRGEQRIALTGKTFDVLRLLVEAEGRLVRRETFNKELWPDVTVEDRNLTVHVSTLRKALNAPSAPDSYIETVATIGYRMAVPVRRLSPTQQTATASAEIRMLESEARAQLNKAERLPALKALSLFERLLAVDPGHAAAHAGLASTYFLLKSTTIRRPLPVKEATQLARESAQRALVLDPHQGEAQAVLGQLKMYADWDWSGADRELARAVAIDPGSAAAHEARGWFLTAMCRGDEAVAALDKARRLAPTCRPILEYLGLACWCAGENQRALAALGDAIALDPESRRPHFRRMIVLDQLGRHDEAMADRVAWLRLFEEPAFADRLTSLQCDGAWRTAMVEWIHYLEDLSQWHEAAIQWVVIGEITRALAALNRLVAERGDGAPFLRAFPSFRSLAGEPRFEDLLRTIGLDDASLGVAGPAPPLLVAT